MRDHLVINFKRAGLKIDATVMQVGAVLMSEDGDCIDEFQVSLKLLNLHGSADPEVLNWWINNDDTRKSYIEAEKFFPDQAAYKFNNFILNSLHDPKSLKIWGNVNSLYEVTNNFINLTPNSYKPKFDKEQFGHFNTLLLANNYPVIPDQKNLVTALDFARHQATFLIKLLRR